MVHITISADDAAILREVLEAKILDLKKESWHTDHHAFRDVLTRRAAALEHVLAQASAPEVTAP
jgi:hypothetical protein